VVLITPRDSIAQDTALVTRQGITRRLHEKRIETVLYAEPRWSERFEDGILEYVNLYTGDTSVIEEVVFLAYSTPRAPQDALAAPLRAAGIDVRLVGDCVSARGVMSATAEGHSAGNAI
jgi:dimethylglycine catabolism A